MGSAQAITFGQLLKRYRIAAGMTQEALAERSGLAVRSLSDLERDVRRLPHPNTIQRVVVALQLSAKAQAALTATIRPIRTPASDSPTKNRAVSALAPFVGRADAMERVEHFLVDQEPPILLFAGEPGIGKSRILLEAAAAARATGWRVLVGGCTRRSGQASYAPFTDALAQALAQTSPKQQRLDLQGSAWLIRLLPELSARAPTPLPSWTLPPEQERRLLFAAVRRYLSNVAGPSGTLLVLDDLQWAGDDALDLLESLARVSADTVVAPLLLIGAYRDTEVSPNSSLTLLAADLARDELVAQHPVLALDHRESLLLADLVLTTLRDADRVESRGAPSRAMQGTPEPSATPFEEPSALARQLARRAGGVPFFLESCAIGLHLSGQVGPDGATSTDPALELPRVPWRVIASIRQRISALPLDAQQLVGALTVVGRSVSFGLLAAVLDWPKSQLMWAVEAACRSRVIEEIHSGTPHHAIYQFAHDLIREIAADDISAGRRIVLHHAVGVALEACDAVRRPEELAFHFAQAGEYERALPYALLAGDQAESVYAHAEATDHYRSALAAARELSDRAREAEALEKLGVVTGLLGHNDEAIESLEGALLGYGASEDQDGELRTLAALLEIQGLYGREMVDAATARAQAVLTRIEPSDRSQFTSKRTSGLAAVYRSLALVYLGSGRYDDLLLTARRAAELARAAGDERQLVWALHRLYVAGGLDDDPTALDTILAMAERSGQAMIAVFAHNMIAARYEDAGEFAQGMPHMEQSLAVAEERGDLIHLAWQLRNFGEFLFNAGDWTRAREISARAESIIREADSPCATWQAVGISIWPGMMAMVEGREEEGRRLLDHSIARIEQIGHLALLDTPMRLLAEADVLAGRAERAERRLTSYLQAPHPTPAESEALSAQVLLAWAEGVLGHTARARARLAVVLDNAKPLVRVDALRVQGLLATLEGRWNVASMALEEAIVHSHAMPSPYAEAKALWVAGRLEVARGEPVAARDRFVEALAICARLGEGLYRAHTERDLKSLETR